LKKKEKFEIKEKYINTWKILKEEIIKTTEFIFYKLYYILIVRDGGIYMMRYIDIDERDNSIRMI
jgi:hypothetical protein